MCETVTSSAAVAGHHGAVHVRISLADEVYQTPGVSGLLGRAGSAVAANYLRESHWGQR